MGFNNEYNQKSIKIGIATVAAAIVANFAPGIYFYFATGFIPSFPEIVKIFSVAATAFAVSWFLQPVTFYTMMGLSGSYIGWVTGNCAGIRCPAITMAQKVAGYEAGTPEGDVMATLGVSASAFLTVAMISFFCFVGVNIIDSLPPFIKAGFKYILPAVFGAVYMQLCMKHLAVGLATIALAVGQVYAYGVMGVPGWITNVMLILTGVVAAYVIEVKLAKA